MRCFMLGQSNVLNLETMVPRGGIDPPTRGFSVLGVPYPPISRHICNLPNCLNFGILRYPTHPHMMVIPCKDLSLIKYPIGCLCGLPANLLNLGEVDVGSIRVLHIT
jgi:hypothetical protein